MPRIISDSRLDDPKWLREEYCERKRKLSEIAVRVGCHYTTILRRMEKLGIPRRTEAGWNKPQYKELVDKNWLEEKYQRSGLTIKEIEGIVGCTKSCVRYWLDKHEIPRRESHHRGNHVEITNILGEFLEGHLLGDGCILKVGGGRSASFQLTDSFEEYVRWLDGTLREFGVGRTGRIYKLKNFGVYVRYSYCSRSYRELADFRNRWYGNGRKEIPQSLELSPTRLLFWYIGDGTLRNEYAPKRYRASIAVHCFGTAKPAELIRSVGVGCSEWGGKEIGIGRKFCEHFFQYLARSPFEPPHCYAYKFPDYFWKYREKVVCK